MAVGGDLNCPYFRHSYIPYRIPSRLAISTKPRLPIDAALYIVGALPIPPGYNTITPVNPRQDADQDIYVTCPPTIAYSSLY